LYFCSFTINHPETDRAGQLDFAGLEAAIPGAGFSGKWRRNCVTHLRIEALAVDSGVDDDNTP
jgi:hypothetical protein